MKKMKIKLSDVGRVKNAEVVFDGITVVAGNNGSGKSTISKSLYTVLEASYDVQNKVIQQQRRSINTTLNRWLTRTTQEIRRMLRSPSTISMVFHKRNLDREQFFMQISRAFDDTNTDEAKKQIEFLYHQYIELYDKTPLQYNNYIAQVIADEVFPGK